MWIRNLEIRSAVVNRSSSIWEQTTGDIWAQICSFPRIQRITEDLLLPLSPESSPAIAGKGRGQIRKVLISQKDIAHLWSLRWPPTTAGNMRRRRREDETKWHGGGMGLLVCRVRCCVCCLASSFCSYSCNWRCSEGVEFQGRPWRRRTAIEPYWKLFSTTRWKAVATPLARTGWWGCSPWPELPRAPRDALSRWVFAPYIWGPSVILITWLLHLLDILLFPVLFFLMFLLLLLLLLLMLLLSPLIIMSTMIGSRRFK